MALGGTRLFVALDARAAVAATVAGGLGRPRLRGFARVPLGPGALVPSPSGASLAGGEEVREAVRRAVSAAGPADRRATLVLPDGLARLALVELPGDADARDFARFRMAGSLPWPAADAVFDALPVGRGRVIAAALRRAAVAEFEQVCVASALEVDRVNLAPLLAVAALPRSAPRDAVHVVLGDAAACVVVVRAGAIAALRSRRRDPSLGEAGRLAAEAGRAARLAANGSGPSVPELPVAFRGADAARLRQELGYGEPAGVRGAGEWPQAAEAAWLAGVLA